jgi:hypothetical protein
VSKAFNMEDPAVVRRLLPAMRRMVRFPAKPVATISTELNIELSQLEGFVKAYGKPTEAKIETLEDWLAGIDPTKVEEVGHVWTQKTFPPRGAVAVAEVPSKSTGTSKSTSVGRTDLAAVRHIEGPTVNLSPNKARGEPYTAMLSVRPNVIAGWIPELRKLANGVPVMDIVAGTDKTAQSLWKLKRRYFGLNMLTPARFEAFLAWCQEKGVEVPAEAGGALEAEPAAELGAEGETEKQGPAAESTSTNTSKSTSAGHGAFVVSGQGGELFRLEVVVRLVPVKGGAE